MSSPTCRCVVATKIGDYASSLKISDEHPARAVVFEDPLPSGTLRVRVLSCGLAFPDVLIVEGKHITKSEPPFVPTNDVCGRIVALGDVDEDDVDVPEFAVGDVVFGVAITGGLSEFALLSAANTYHVPAGVEPQIAAGFEVNYGTTWHGLVDLAGLSSGEILLVLGASGGVGMAAIDIGKAMGATVVACASTDEKLNACRAAGADVLINYSGGAKALKQALKAADVYGSIDVVYDPVGGTLSEVSLRALAWGGRFLVVGFASGGMSPKEGIPRPPLNLVLLNERKVLGVFWGAWKMRDGNEKNRKNMNTMMDMVSKRTLRPVITKVYDMRDFMQAFNDMVQRRVTGKVCVAVSAASARY